MGYSFCEKCEDYKTLPCNCITWLVCPLDEYFEGMPDGDYLDVYSDFPEDAAEKYGKSYNEDGDYSLMNDSITLVVVHPITREVKHYQVSAEPDIYYSTEEITNES